MISQNPKLRPPLKVVLSHPLFWSTYKALQFLVDLSNAMEDVDEEEDAGSSAVTCIHTAKNNYSKALYRSWNEYLTNSVRKYLTSGKYRRYDFSSVMNLVRAIRNLHNHHSKLNNGVKKDVGNLPGPFLRYWLLRFPFLIDHLWTDFHQIRNKPEYGMSMYYEYGNDYNPRKPDQSEQDVFDAFLLTRS